MSQRREAVLIQASKAHINELAARLDGDQIVVMPYGKKERRVFAMLGSAHSHAVIERMLAIKNRAASQAIAISGIPEVAPLVGRLDDTHALSSRSKVLGVPPWAVVDACFDVGAVGLILAAQGWLPAAATRLSTTMLDLTGPKAKVLGWGNVYPGHFRAVFPDLVFKPRHVKKHRGRERRHHVLLKKLMANR